MITTWSIGDYRAQKGVMFYIEGDIIYVLICKLLFIYEICGTPVIVKARKDIVMLL
ncbi:transmembrane protein, putative [Medicago truncatula]|uniref:Transmembrane protein, putative n=1 Tax=Medicago truncatula TaxID=3880 RepID=A0A072V0H0_MEDTR|nr:transmembrane protein, putative [Medicago truncatula]